MKNIKLLVLSLVLLTATMSAHAQTLARSLVLKPSGETNALTLTSSTPIGAAYTINLPGGGSALTGPIVRSSTSAGNKTWTFGQVDLSLNAAGTGDVTGALGVTNGGTGLSAIPINSMLYASAANTLSALSPGTTGQVLGSVSGVPTWGTTLGGGGATTNISSTGAGNTTNINASPATGGTTNIGNATSTTAFTGAVTFASAPTIPLAQNNIWVGNASGNQAATAPSINSVLITNAVAGGTPQWGTTLPAGLTVPTATITGPTLTGGTINNTPIGGTTPSTGAFTTLSSTGNSALGTGASTTNSFGTGSSAANTIGSNTGPSTTTINGNVTFGGATPVSFTVMPSLPLTLNNMYVGNASNKASELATVASKVLLSSAAGAPTWSTLVPIANGGTNSGTALSGNSIMVSNGTSVVQGLQGSATTVLHGGVGGPTFSAVALGASGDVTGVLPIANGGTNSTATPINGGVIYGDGTSYQSTVAGTSGQILKSNGAATPTWVSVNSLLSNAAFTYTTTATDAINNYASITTTSVPTLISAYQYSVTAKVIITYETATGPGQVATVTDRDLVTVANGFRIWAGNVTAGDKIHIVIIP